MKLLIRWCRKSNEKRKDLPHSFKTSNRRSFFCPFVIASAEKKPARWQFDSYPRVVFCRGALGFYVVFIFRIMVFVVADSVNMHRSYRLNPLGDTLAGEFCFEPINRRLTSIVSEVRCKRGQGLAQLQCKKIGCSFEENVAGDRIVFEKISI